MEIEGLLDNSVPKSSFKRIVKSKLNDMNDEEIKSEMNNFKKMDLMRKEPKKKNDYIKKENIPHGRILFKHRRNMYKSKLNLKNDPTFRKEGYLCDSCMSKEDDNLHVLFCDSYRDLRQGKSLLNDKDLATYLLQVLNIRKKLSWNK